MARRKRGGPGPRSRGTNRKRAGSGKGPKRSFGKGVSAGVLGSIGAAVIGKLFNRDEKEVEEMGGRFGKDQERLLEELVGGTPDEAKAQIEEAYGGTPAGAKAQIEEAYAEDPLKKDIDATLQSLEEKLAAAKKEARLEQRRRDTPEQRAGEQPGPPLGAEEEPVGAHQFEGTPPLGAGQGVRAAPPLSTTIAKRAGGPEFSAPPRLGPGQGVRNAPLGALAAPQTEPTAKERFASVFGGHRDRMEESRGALFGGNGGGGGDQVPMPQNYREETIAKLSEEERQDFEGLSPEEQQAQLNEMWKQQVSGTAGAAESPTDFLNVAGKVGGGLATTALGYWGAKQVAQKAAKMRAAKLGPDDALRGGTGRASRPSAAPKTRSRKKKETGIPGQSVPH